MSKKQKSQSSIQPSSPFKIVLPVLIGLVVVIAATIIIAIASTPKKSAKVENPNDTFVTIGDYEITNQKMYEVLKSQYGINKAVELIDTALLKDVVVDPAEKEKIINEVKYGEDYEKLTPEERELKDKVYANNLVLSGYRTEAEVAAYEDLVCKRTIKAKELYAKYMESNDYTAEEYESAYEELYGTESNALVLYITFATKAQGEKVLEEIGGILSSSIKSSTTSNYNGWENKDKVEIENEIKKLSDERSELVKSKETAETDKVAEIEEQIALKTQEIAALNERLELDAADIALAYIKVYNYVNAYYAKDFSVDTYFKDGELVAGKELLKEGVHYTIETVKSVVDNPDTEEDETVEGYRYVKFDTEALETLNQENPNCKFLFTEEEASKLDQKEGSTTSTGKFNSTIMGLTAYKDAKSTLKDAYTTEFKAMASGEYFVAYKFGGEKAVESTLDFSDKAKDENKPSEELLKELKAHLVTTQFNDDIETQMLLGLRQDNDVKFYDRFLNASYKAAYVYLFETTLKLAEYTPYAENNKTSKTLAFSYKVGEEVVEYTAQKLFELLANQYGPQSTVKLVNAYALLSNAKYNEIYDPYQDKVYDKEAYTNVMSGFNYYNLLYGNLTTVKEYKYAFENGVFESYGFDESYGWKNFVRDYLVENDTQFLAGALSQSYAQQNYFVEQYDHEKILANMKKLYDEYFSLNVINLLVYVNYDNDATPDEYKVTLEEGETQESWTEAQVLLAKELVAKLYEAKEAVTEESKDTLKEKLEAVVKEYNEASYSDDVWGKYLQAGLKVKTDSGEYTSSKTTATELLNKEFAVIYQELEKAGTYKFGEKTAYETPYEYAKTVDTEYGFYRVAVTNAGKRIATGDDGQTDYKVLTKEIYQKHLDGEELSENVETGLEYYYEASIKELYDSNEQNVLVANLRDTLTANVKYANDAYKATYVDTLKRIRNNIDYAVQEAEFEEE